MPLICLYECIHLTKFRDSPLQLENKVMFMCVTHLLLSNPFDIHFYILISLTLMKQIL